MSIRQSSTHSITATSRLNRAPHLPLAATLALVALACSSSDDPTDQNVAPATAGGGAGTAGTSSAVAGGGSAGSAVSMAGTTNTVGGNGGTANTAAGAGAGGMAAGGEGPVAGAGGASAGAAGMETGEPTPPGTGGPAVECTFTFCEDFEGFADGATPMNERWSELAETAPGNMVVDALKPARGKNALHIKYTTTADRMYHWIKTTEPFPALAAKHFARLFVYVVAPPDPGGAYQHWTTVFVGGDENNNLIRLLGGENTVGTNHFGPMVNPVMKGGEGLYNSPDGAESRRVSATPIPGDEWECYEWSYDSAANSFQMWRDSVELTDVAWNDQTAPDDGYDFPEPTYIWLGWTEYHPNNVPWEVYLDEFALDDERIGCDK